jgi:hypothetical protein
VDPEEIRGQSVHYTTCNALCPCPRHMYLRADTAKRDFYLKPPIMIALA